MKVKDSLKEIESKKGSYIILSGLGMLDGLNFKAKSNCHKIIGIRGMDLILRGYRRRCKSVLPYYNANQEFLIYTKQQFLKLPTY